MDGHSGIDNREVNRGSSGDFLMVFSFLKEANGRGVFVIHATSSVWYGSGLQPLQFLQQIGFSPFSGECKFHRDRCFYRIFAELEYDEAGFGDERQTMYVHSAFENFANNGIGKLYQLQKQQNDVLREIRLTGGEIGLFGSLPKMKIEPSNIPAWVDLVKFQRLKGLEKQREGLNSEINDLREYLPLLFGDGNILEAAVIKSLKTIGLRAEPTAPGFTADILAETEDGRLKFGFEVTGTSEAIKKESKKLTQLLEFERIKEHGEKTILVANTFKNTPISERTAKDSFTRPVIDFLSMHPILLMTGYDLYRVVGDVLINKDLSIGFIGRLHNESGVFVY